MATPPNTASRKGIKNGEFVDLAPDEIDYILDDNSALMGQNINLVPLQNAVSSQRLFYSSRFFSQADPLEDPDEPLVQNRYRGDKSFDALAGEKAGAVRSDEEGEVSGVNEKEIVLNTESGEKRIPLYNHFSLNRKNQLHQTPVVKPGQRVKKGDLLAKSNFTNNKGTLAMGRNARMALVPYLGYSMDDATVISESFANRLKSNHLVDFSTNSSDNIERGKHTFSSVFGGKYSPKQLEKIDEDGVVKPGTVLEKNDPVLLGFSRPNIRSEDRLKGTFGKYLKNRARDNSETWEYDSPGVVRDVKKRKDGSYAITVETNKPAEEGDKVVNRSGAKFTISRVIPDGEMPHTPDGERFDMLANPLGIPSRTNNAFIYEMLLGKIAEKTGEPVVTDGFNDPQEKWNERVREMLDEHGVSDTEMVYDPVAQQYLENPVTTGNMHLLKLQHQGGGKLSARGQGGYTQWEQPRKGGDEGGQSKRLSGLELSGLLSSGAYGYIKDGATVRGQRNDDYWRAIREGRTPPKPGKPFAWDRAKAMMHGGGYMLRDQRGGTTRLGPLTDKDIDKWEAEELKNPETINFKTGKGVPGGLFDEGRAFRNKWAKISLDFPLPNPSFEKQVRTLLGLKQKEIEEVISGNREIGEYGTGPNALYKALKDIDKESLKEKMKETIRGGVKTKRKGAIDILNTIEGLDRNDLQPKDLMMTQVPVLPSRFRPFVFEGDMFMPGDVNELYSDVFRLRDQHRELRDTLGEEGSKDHRMDVYRGLRALYGTDKTRNKKLSEKDTKGFVKQLLGESPKYSVFQRNLFSKPVDSSARGVAGLDPTLGIDEVGIPESVAWKLYAPYIQRRLVKGGMSPAQALKATRDRIPRAKAALEEEMRERPGVVNRAPSWHKYNSVGSKFVTHSGKNIRVNPLITTGMNLDFDGDQQINSVFMRIPRRS